ncbi:aminomethyltransferase family protein [Halobellus captivus]|uniref:aminomethyltransferase family protein n=1 Tax=Halobellus captivus TaxID=2592614 RepID=UPI0011A1DAD3|nr:aminomethyltransferase family protein [Halobellus captivus]
MSGSTLASVVQSTDSVVELFRSRGSGSLGFPNVPDERTNWIEEQRAWAETCSLADQSHHMVDYWVSGPDAIALFSDLAVNGFDGFEPGMAKQLVLSNPDGYFIADGILLYLDDGELALVGPPQGPNWVQYHVETGKYDVTTERDETSGVREGPPTNYRYQLQGPEAVELMDEVTDEPLPDLGFFHFTDVTIDGRTVTMLRHGMSGEAGFEFWGPWADAEAIKSTILDAGSDRGIRQLGAKSYGSSAVVSGWVGMPLPAVYDSDAMEGYRNWLSAHSLEAHYSIAGSFNSDDITDYYVTPIELGYGRLIDFDHDFVGKAALEAEAEKPSRTLVTLEWNDEDVIDLFASLLENGDTGKFLDLPVPWRSASHYDSVLDGDTPVGMSMWAAYTYNERAVISLAVVDTAVSDPGTELTLVWGEPNERRNPAVERHALTEISATVSPVPYTADNR